MTLPILSAALDGVDWLEAFARLHPLVLHLPIGLFLVLAIVELMQPAHRLSKEVGRDRSRAVLVVLLLVTTPLAAATGWFLHETADYGPPVGWHERLGIALALTALCVGVAYRYAPRYYVLALVLGVVLLIPTAHLGATLTHGADYLLAPWREAPASPLREAPLPQAHVAPAADETEPEPEIEPSAVATEHLFAGAEPIFAAYCTRCHGERRQRGGLALHDLESLLAGSENGPVVVPGRPDASRLIEVLGLPIDDDFHMPPEDKKQPTADAIAALGTWIAGLTAADLAARGPAPDELAGSALPIANAQPDSDPATAVRVDPAAIAAIGAAVAELRERLVHVERLAADSEHLEVDFTAASVQPGEPAALLAPLGALIADLDLGATTLDATDLDFLGRLPHLERLDLHRLELNGSAASVDLAALTRSPSLRVLNLSGTALDDDAVEQLASIATLEQVFLWNTGLRPSNLKDLADRRPDLRVFGASAPLDEPVEVEPEVVFVRVAPEPQPFAPGATGLVAENTTCPVSGSPVDLRYVVVHEGRAIAFCCPNCPKSFWEDPERFLAATEGD